jgi:uncharacterized protein
VTAEDVIRVLNLRPHPREGGWFSETYRSPTRFVPDDYPGERHHSTAIYYLLTPETYSRLHRLRGDEVFHHYAGDAVEMLQLRPDGRGEVIVIGSNLPDGERPQVLAPKHVWQGSRLRPGGAWALLGCTVAPGFEYEDYEDETRGYFLERYAQHSELIEALTPADEM